MLFASTSPVILPAPAMLTDSYTPPAAEPAPEMFRLPAP